MTPEQREFFKDWIDDLEADNRTRYAMRLEELVNAHERLQKDLDDAIEVVREFPVDHTYHKKAIEVYAKWCDDGDVI